MTEGERGKPFGPHVAESEKEKPTNTVKDSWLAASIEGNLRIPQVHFGIAIFLAEALLKDSSSSVREFNDSELSSEQISRLLKIRENAHGANNINSRINEEKLVAMIKQLWENEKLYAVRTIYDLHNALHPNKPINFYNKISELDEVLRDSSARESLLNAVSIMSEELKSPDMLKATSEYRNSLSESSLSMPYGEDGEAMLDSIKATVLNRLDEHHPGIRLHESFLDH